MAVNNLLTGYKVGNHEPVVVSHLQFANDTIIVCEKSWANIRAIRAILLLFEDLSGLKVNFSKSLLVGVNVHGSWLSVDCWAMVTIRCFGLTSGWRVGCRFGTDLVGCMTCR